MGIVSSQERVVTNNTVEMRASKLRAHTKAHLTVQDLIQFADLLKERDAPSDNQIRALLVDKDGYLLFSVATYWTMETINGEPAPQVLEKAEAPLLNGATQ